MQLLKKEMRLKGFNIKELAQRVGVSPGNISGWLNGSHLPTSKHVKILSDLGFSDGACLNPSKNIEV